MSASLFHIDFAARLYSGFSLVRLLIEDRLAVSGRIEFACEKQREWDKYKKREIFQYKLQP